MQQKDAQKPRDPRAPVSRRDLLLGGGAIAAAASLPALGQHREEDDDPPATGPIFAYVGAYTPNGQGIHIFKLDPGTGVLTPIKVFSTPSPSWLAFDAAKKTLYAVNEISNFNGGTTGSVTALSVNGKTGDLAFINAVTSGGAGPAHLSVDPLGKFVFVANYGGGNVAVLPIMAGGLLGNPTTVVNDITACSPACPVGPTQAAKAPPGSFAISGHDGPHAHMIQADAAGKFVIAQDLGLDLTIVWQFNRVAGTLANHQTVPSSAGAGPRHFVFHPNGRWFYSLNEEASTLAFMTYDAASGTLTPKEETTTLPASFKGTNFTSEIIISRSGRFIYVLNRLHNSIGIFAVEGNGSPKLIGDVWTRADYPRSCNIDPTGRFLYVCHNRGDNVTTFRVDGENGHLTFTGAYTAVGSPAVIVFLS